MCMPHGGGSKSNGFIKDDKHKKHIQRVSKEQFEKGDPDFIDERIAVHIPKKTKESIFSFFSSD